MKEEKVEGIVLRSLDFKDRQKIITVFTKEKGLLTLIIKGISLKKYHLITLSSLFTEAEYVLRKGRSDIATFLDGTTLEENLFLRENYSHLQTGGMFAKAILRSQMPNKASPLLYELFRIYLKELKNHDDPTALLASYYLKILQHEGLFIWKETCSVCHKHPVEFLDKGEGYCTHHITSAAYRFSKEEWYLIRKLAETRKLQEVRENKISLEFCKKIESYFEESTK